MSRIELGLPLSFSREYDVRRGRRRHMLGARIAQRRQVDPRKERLTTAEQDRRDRDMHLVDEPRLEILAHRGRPAADLDIEPSRGLPGATERFLNSAGDEMKDGPALHRDRFACVVRQHEHRHVIRRVLAPPAVPPVVPPVFPFISRNARVPMYQPCSSSPPTPSGSFSPWRGPAPYPSSEIAKLWTRSLDMESFSGFHTRRMGRPEIDRRRMSWGAETR